MLIVREISLNKKGVEKVLDEIEKAVKIVFYFLSSVGLLKKIIENKKGD